MTEIVSFIKEVGFPIFVGVYMLINNNVQLKKTNIIFTELKTLIGQKCVKEVR